MRPIKDRFMEKVEASKSCWVWTAGKSTHGYGRFQRSKKVSAYAHRISWEIHKGPIPDGSHVLHTCDNRLCVNPSHLFLGSNRDNVNDKVAKGRQQRLPGDQNGRAKLNQEQVLEIRSRFGGGCDNWCAAAREYGVTRTTIKAIAKGRSWKEVV